MTRVITLFTSIVLSSLLSASAQDKLPAITPEDPKLGRPVDFERDVYPILDAKCVACHNVAVDESKLVLEDVEGILKGGEAWTIRHCQKARGKLVVQNGCPD